MICSGKQVELECSELQSTIGLISKCVFLNGLLSQAHLDESHLESDPIFHPNGKATLNFATKKDASRFTFAHEMKFQKHTKNTETERAPVNAFAAAREAIARKTNTAITGRTKVGFNLKDGGSDGEASGNEITTTQAIVPAKPVAPVVAQKGKKGKNGEAYEILTIRAKLKQRVDQNRSKQVSLGDVDLIMRNVVTIIQDEFMKRFPSSPSANPDDPNAVASHPDTPILESAAVESITHRRT